MSNSYICPLHRQEANDFCFCESTLVYLCSSCLPKHEGHEIYSMKHFELFQLLSHDRTALKSRLETNERCSNFITLLIANEAIEQSNAGELIRRVTKMYEELLLRRHRSFEDVVDMLKEELELMLCSASPQVSQLSQTLQAKSGELGLKECEAFLKCSDISGLQEVLSRVEKTCAKSQRVWHRDYEDQILVEISAVQTPILAQASADFQPELAGPLPDYRTPAAKAALDRLGPYFSQVEDSSLVKRGPVSADGGYYIGQWNSKQQRHGHGQQFWSNGALYEGQWTCGKRSGKGRLISPQGEVYIGDFVMKRMTGFGELYEADGTKYIGGFSDGKKNGIGCLIAGPSSRHTAGVYYGEWKEGFLQGKAVCFYANGSTYAGEWLADKENGKGVFVNANVFYSGNYERGVCSGPGMGIWPESGHIYRGSWKAGKRCGIGRLTCPGQVYYDGPWVDDKEHGTGMYRGPDGIVVQRAYINGVVID